MGFQLDEGGFWLRVKASLGQGRVMARWGWLLAQDDGGFGPGWG
jgi:hypothetical protein